MDSEGPGTEGRQCGMIREDEADGSMVESCIALLEGFERYCDGIGSIATPAHIREDGVVLFSDRIKRRVERGAFCHFDVEGHREGVPDGGGDKLAAPVPGKN